MTTPAYAHRANVNGLDMYFELHGGGRPLVLLHGGGSTAQSSFGALIPRLAPKHRLILPEQQAHGHSGDRDAALSFQQMADDTAALLDVLGVEDTDVLGFSNGGLVALELALRHRARVRHLVVCSTLYARSGVQPDFWRGFAGATFASMPAPLREAFFATAPDPAAAPARFAKQVALMEHFRDVPEASLRALDTETLVMIGDRDVMSVEHAAKLARLLPRAELAVMPGSGHGTYLGAAEGGDPGPLLPGVTATLLEHFLTR